MGCIHLSTPCNLRECALILLGGKRGDKQQRQCYTSTLSAYNELMNLDAEYKHSFYVRTTTTAEQQQMKDRIAELKGILHL